MRLLSRVLFWELLISASLGTAVFTMLVFMQRASGLFEILVRNSGPLRTVAYLFALVLPQALPQAIPLGVLIGTLITLSRMSADGEITAMRAAGVSGRSVAPPILLCGTLGLCLTAAASLWLTPWSIRERYHVLNELIASQLTAEVQPRVFQEQFPDHMVYVADVLPGTTAHWRRIFIADTTPPDKLPPGVAERGDSPRITIAPDAIAIPDVPRNRVQLSLQNGSTYEAGKDPTIDYRIIRFDHGDQVLQAQRPSEVRLSRPAMETDTLPLFRDAYLKGETDRITLLDERIELHQRLALPLACVLLALTGIPLGLTSRRAGKSSAVVLTMVIALLYYMGLVGMISLARQGSITPELAVWSPNLVFLLAAAVLLSRLERPGDFDFIGFLVGPFGRTRSSSQSKVSSILDRLQPKFSLKRFALMPQVVDTYMLSSFLFYFVVLLVSFVTMFHIFTFFELLGDIIKNRISVGKILQYHLMLSPRLIYTLAPPAVLTAVLVVFGVMTKSNEVTAFKASGISVYRLAVPILITTLFLSGGLFAFDHYWVPEADRLQDSIRNEIKGRPPQTFLNPNRKWVSGLNDRIYYYKYYDQTNDAMIGVNVFEIDWAHNRLKRHIAAERARWEPALRAWVFQNGWSRGATLDNFTGDLRSFPDLKETPDYFVKEARQSRQMNFRELDAYIRELQQSGFNTIPLQVQFYKKFSLPLFAFILAMVSVPFALLAGNRGAMAGTGMALVIFFAYWSVGQIFEQIGDLNQLPPAIAAWSPDAAFSVVGLYFLVRMRT